MKVEKRADRVSGLSMITNNVSETGCDSPKGIEHAGVIDSLSFDPQRGEVRLVMIEKRPWDGSQKQLFQLQEKMNAYFSFVLDGEMAEAYPAFANKPVRIRLECATPPEEECLRFLQAVYDHASLQGLAFEAEVLGKRCGCGKPTSECSG